MKGLDSQKSQTRRISIKKRCFFPRMKQWVFYLEVIPGEWILFCYWAYKWTNWVPSLYFLSRVIIILWWCKIIIQGHKYIFWLLVHHNITIWVKVLCSFIWIFYHMKRQPLGQFCSERNYFMSNQFLIYLFKSRYGFIKNKFYGDLPLVLVMKTFWKYKSPFFFLYYTF